MNALPDKERMGQGKTPRARLYRVLPSTILAFLLYLNSLAGDFQFDDYHHVYNNPRLRSLSEVPGYFTDPSAFSAEIGVRMYRPLLLLTFAVNYALGGLAPLGYHLVSVLLHAANSFLVFLLLRRWFPGRAAGWGSVFFAAAAVHTQAVNYISSRSELLAAFFVLAALTVDRADNPERNNWLSIACAALLFGLGLLSKETAFVFPFLVILLDVAGGERWRETIRRRLWAWSIYLAAAFGYLGLRVVLFSAVLDRAPRSILMNVFALPRSLFWYAGRVALPVHLRVIHDFRVPQTIADPGALLAWAGLAALVFLALRSLRRAPWFAAGLFWYIICLLPSSSLMPLNVVVSEQRVYLGSVGLLMIAAGFYRGLGLGQGWTRRPGMCLLAVIIALQACLTLARNPAWRTELSLWRDAVKKEPGIATTWAWLGVSLTKDKRHDQAEAALRRALVYNAQDPVALYYLGLVLKEKDDPQAALRAFDFMYQTAQAPSQKADALGQKGLALYNLGRAGEAQGELQKGLEFEPDNFYCLYGLGLLAEKAGRDLEAESYYQAALRKLPGAPEVELRMGVIYLRQEEPENAVPYLERVVAQDLGWPEAHLNLAAAYYQTGQKEKALEQYQRCFAVDPTYAKCYLSAGSVYAAAGDERQARIYLEKAIALEPDLAAARENLAVLLIRGLGRGSAKGNSTKEVTDLIFEQINWFAGHGYPDKAQGLADYLRKTAAGLRAESGAPGSEGKGE